MKRTLFLLGFLCMALLRLATNVLAADKDKPQPSNALERAIEALVQSQDAERRSGQTAGSVWSPAARFSDLAADLRARRVGDLVTILVEERASAVSSGSAQSTRESNVESGITAVGGLTRIPGPLSNLAGGGTTQSLNGQGTTSRDTALTTTMSALVTQVLPNGYLVVEGIKTVGVNSENQTVVVRGVVRPVDLDTRNAVSSVRIAQMEIRVNGKGIVADSVRRPFILYRILLGLLPF
jgi:flagellar L-ring protein precursor FlgH